MKKSAKTATVAYEDPKVVGALARYEKRVEHALHAMGATKIQELLGGSQAFVLGNFRGGVDPKTTAAVIWHKHCEAGLTAHVPCVAREETGASCPPEPAPKVAAVVVAEETEPKNALPESGYAYVAKLTKSERRLGLRHYRTIPNDEWKIEVVTPTGTEKEAGLRLIDGTPHRVWLSGDGNEYWAQVAHGPAKPFGSREEAHDGGLGCQPFTRLERDVRKLDACRARAAGPLDTDEKMFRFLKQEMNVQDQEVFVVVGLDLHHNLRSYTEVARGQRDRVAVSVEDILRVVIADGPHGFLVAHNHPSGNARPSSKDKELTRKIEEAASVACPNVVFLDHLIIGSDNWYSFRDGKQKK